MKKSDLKEFDIVKLRDGDILIVLRNTVAPCKLGTFTSTGCCVHYLDQFDEDLTYPQNKTNDIVEVLSFKGIFLSGLLSKFYDSEMQRHVFANNALGTTWKRLEVEEMTLEEVCKALGKEIKIVKK